MTWPIGLSRLESPKPIDLDGTTQSANLILDGIEADDLGEFNLYRIVGRDERILDLFDLVFLDGFLFFLAGDSYLKV